MLLLLLLFLLLLFLLLLLLLLGDTLKGEFNSRLSLSISMHLSSSHPIHLHMSEEPAHAAIISFTSCIVALSGRHRRKLLHASSSGCSKPSPKVTCIKRQGTVHMGNNARWWPSWAATWDWISMIPWRNKIRRTHSWACPDNLEHCMEGFKYPILNRTLCCMQNLWMTKWLPPQPHCLFRHNLSHADCLAMKTFLLPLEVVPKILRSAVIQKRT